MVPTPVRLKAVRPTFGRWAVRPCACSLSLACCARPSHPALSLRAPVRLPAYGLPSATLLHGSATVMTKGLWPARIPLRPVPRRRNLRTPSATKAVSDTAAQSRDNLRLRAPLRLLSLRAPLRLQERKQTAHPTTKARFLLTGIICIMTGFVNSPLQGAYLS